VINASGTEEHKPVSSIFSAEIQAAVRAELEMILEAPSFAQSNRCKRFLSFIVVQTLSGHASELKERTIGIGVFDRAIDYDTGGDSIVRVTSNEVRKRISQFYAESTRVHSIQIDLPRGSYVPEFRILPSKRSNESAQTATVGVSDRGVTEGKISTAMEAPLSANQSHEPNNGRTILVPAEALKRTRSWKLLTFVALLIVLLISGATSVVVLRNRAEKEIPQIWEAFQRSNVPVLIVLGTHDIPDATIPSSRESEKFTDLVLHKNLIPVDDVSVIASMASLLGKKSIPFRVVGAEQASLTDLRRQPVILIGAADNKWTLRLSRDLRYRVEFVPPGQNRIPVATIIDSQQPNSTPWKLDYTIPMDEWKNDYAIVARLDDPTTGIPVLIDAGLGNDGSLAASELIASDGLTRALSAEPRCMGKSNFEAVIGTEIIGSNPGPPHIIRLECW
jgi:hypothetical protein